MIGDVESVLSSGRLGGNIVKTTNGCFTNIGSNEFDYLEENPLDCKSLRVHGRAGRWDSYTGPNNTTLNCGELYGRQDNSKYQTFIGYVYIEDGKIKILCTVPSDERGCKVFKDVFAVAHYDGVYLWDINTGECSSMNW